MDHASPELMVVAADHPSLNGAVAEFGARLRAETRFFGRRGQQAARPVPSLVRRLTTPSHHLRLAGLVDGEIVGLAAVDDDAPDGPELLIAIAAPWRRHGLAIRLGREIVARATARGLDRIVLRTSYPSCEVRAAGEALGLETVDGGRGRLVLARRLEMRSA